eukprot:gene7475-4561_t
MTITYALMEKYEKLLKEQPERCRLITKARVTELVKEGDEVVGVMYERDGETLSERGPVVL